MTAAKKEPTVVAEQETLDGTEVEAQPLDAEAVAKQNAEAEQARQDAANLTDEETSSTPASLKDLTDADLVDQDTGAPKPLSATTQNLQATISNVNGRAVLKLALRGYIGEEPVSVLSEDAGEFIDIIAALDKAAGEQAKASEEA